MQNGASGKGRTLFQQPRSHNCVALPQAATTTQYLTRTSAPEIKTHDIESKTDKDQPQKAFNGWEMDFDIDAIARGGIPSTKSTKHIPQLWKPWGMHRLPPELRIQIYNKLLLEKPTTRGYHSLLRLFELDRRLLREALEIFCRARRFRISEKNAHTFWKALKNPMLGWITHLSVDLR